MSANRNQHVLEPADRSHSNLLQILKEIGELLKAGNFADTTQEALRALQNKLIEESGNANARLRERLEILTEFEKRHLELVKEHKEEIKFINSIQEDLRKERASFFSHCLREVWESLDAVKVGQPIAMDWIKKLVDTYTASLEASQELVASAGLDLLNNITHASKRAVSPIREDNQGNG